MLLQPEISHEVNSNTTAECEAVACHSITDRVCGYDMHTKSPASKKCVGSIENFWGSYTVVCGALFDYCMQVVWNAVFYDSIVECTSAWRKRKLWSDHPKIALPACNNRDYDNTTDIGSGGHVSLRDFRGSYHYYYFACIMYLNSFSDDFTVAIRGRLLYVHK